MPGLLDGGPAPGDDVHPGTGPPGRRRVRVPGVPPAAGRVCRAAMPSGPAAAVAPDAEACAVRFREDKPEDLNRARAAVAAWREQHPQGTAEQLVADLGSQFHPDYAVVLRAVLFTVDSHQARIAAGVSVTEAAR